MNKREKLNNICKQANVCKKCELYKTRNNTVFSDGNPDAKIMLIGEAPGKDEDLSGVPFVGRAGKLLNSFLEIAGIDRKNDIYICNTLKCRPPENRTPTDFEKEQCFEFLNEQINIIKPKIILLCGSCAMKLFIKDKMPISKIRGKWFDYNDEIVMMPIFHPSYLLRNHSLDDNSPRSLTIKDLKEAKIKADL